MYAIGLHCLKDWKLDQEFIVTVMTTADITKLSTQIELR